MQPFTLMVQSEAVELEPAIVPILDSILEALLVESPIVKLAMPELMLVVRLATIIDLRSMHLLATMLALFSLARALMFPLWCILGQERQLRHFDLQCIHDSRHQKLF